MAGDTTDRYKAYECYLLGHNTEKCAQILRIGFTKAKKYYTDFVVAKALKDSNDKWANIQQIAGIETELFENIERFHKNPTPELDNKIKILSKTYSQFQALS